MQSDDIFKDIERKITLDSHSGGTEQAHIVEAIFIPDCRSFLLKQDGSARYWTDRCNFDTIFFRSQSVPSLTRLPEFGRPNFYHFRCSFMFSFDKVTFNSEHVQYYVISILAFEHDFIFQNRDAFTTLSEARALSLLDYIFTTFPSLIPYSPSITFQTYIPAGKVLISTLFCP